MIDKDLLKFLGILTLISVMIMGAFYFFLPPCFNQGLYTNECALRTMSTFIGYFGSWFSIAIGIFLISYFDKEDE